MAVLAAFSPVFEREIEAVLGAFRSGIGAGWLPGCLAFGDSSETGQTRRVLPASMSGVAIWRRSKIPRGYMGVFGDLS